VLVFRNGKADPPRGHRTGLSGQAPSRPPIAVQISSIPRHAKAGDLWTPTITVRRRGVPLPRARVTFRLGTVVTRAVSAGRGRYRAQVELGHVGRFTFSVTVNGRRVRSGRLVVGPPRLRGTYDVIVDRDGTLLVGDASNRVLRVFPGGLLMVVARLRFPVEVAIDPRGSFAVVTEERFVRRPNGRILATLQQPTALVYGADGTLYVSELGGRVVRVGVDGTVAPILSEGLRQPHGLAIHGSTLYVCDTFNNRLLAVDLRTGSSSTAAENLSLPVDVTAAEDGTLYIADYGNRRIARFRAGVVTTAAPLSEANGVAVAPDGSIYVTERAQPRVLRVDPVTGAVTVVAGS
jgi:glucose/arabinose dehydrogenase